MLNHPDSSSPASGDGGYTDGSALRVNESEAAASRGGGFAPELITRKVLEDLVQECRDAHNTDPPVERGEIVKKKRVDLTVPTVEALQAFCRILGASKTRPHSQSSSSQRDTVGGQVQIVRVCVRARAH